MTGLGLLGPAFVAAVAYVDPGNVAANLQAGARYGYLLLWVLVAATAAAGLLQYLSAKLGIATSQSLPELIRTRLRTPARVAYWLQAETVAMATDVAEVVGGAVALNLLFGLPLLFGGVLAAGASLLLLAVQDRRGQRTFEHLVIGLLLLIALGFLAGLVVTPPAPAGVVGGLLPRFSGADSMLLATAMFGATVMPHVVYLHSALARDRFGTVPVGPRQRRLLAATRVDVVISLMLAGGVNIAMLLLAAAALPGREGVDTLEGAHRAITEQVGPVIGVLFAIGLLLSSLASTSVGCYAGSVVMQGLLRRSVGLFTRRVITVVPALIALALASSPTQLLILSQVVLSFGLPFALVPLVRLTSDRTLLGAAVNHRITTLLAWAVTVAITALNVVLIVAVVTG
ncbi:MAG: divalent metal cation transporter [Actinobacteria bacterium 69-20]|nr:Nramp family divalent metal transporter [Actinomycetota bacterium]OJV27961.1 MAG: divalent metal cation transporter [Actinobacteria bacterium 69-20]